MKSRMAGNLSFGTDILPLFRPGDIQCMTNQGLDLSDWLVCRDAATGILSAVSSGEMPPDAPWPADKVKRFSDWVDEGTPKMTGDSYAGFFRSIDARTEYSTDPATSVMPAAITVLNKVLPAWKEYARVANTPVGPAAKQEVLKKLNDPKLKAAIVAVDDLLCGCLEASFTDATSGVLDAQAVLDAFEQFGRDRLPLDAERAKNSDPTQHPANEPMHHRMDSTSMWFNWAGQIDLCVLALGTTDKRHSTRMTMIAGLAVGCPMDFVFRDPASRLSGDKQKPGTRPEYKADKQTEDMIRLKGRLLLQNYDSALQELQELYRFWFNS